MTTRKKTKIKRNRSRKKKGGKMPQQKGNIKWIVPKNRTENICYICRNKKLGNFNCYNEKQNCRRCGNIVCAECSDMQIPIKLLEQYVLNPDGTDRGNVRICDKCVRVRQERKILTPKEKKYIKNNFIFHGTSLKLDFFNELRYIHNLFKAYKN